MEVKNYALIIAKELNLKEIQVKNTLNLLNSGATIPFISRYRKEVTESLTEVEISSIKTLYHRWLELDKRRAAIIDSITEQEKMTVELQIQLENATTLSELEDIYFPYRPKRKTRASIAIEKGLEPIAILILQQKNIDIEEMAKKYIHPEKTIYTVEDVLAGARDIIAEQITENIRIRRRIRELFKQESIITSKVVKEKEKEGEKYTIYFDSSERLVKTPSHRLLALFRGEKEGFLRLTIAPSEEKALEILKQETVKSTNLCSEQVWLAAQDAYKRLLKAQMETEIRQFFKEKADNEAIKVFAINLRQLLMAAPLGQKRVLAIDPGFRTGCKVVILNEQGRLLYNETLYIHPPHAEYKVSSDKLKRLVLQYKIDAIAIGNGTAGRETEDFIKRIPFERSVMAIVVNESGASVYSASDVAREEFPDYDVTVRGAVSIGRRLMDPLAELVKIDPKSIGVGQYQHDVNQILLQESLQETVESCVNAVGVEVNTASKELLSYVSGIGKVLAGKIVAYRDEHGAFKNRETLRQIPRFGEKTFEQAAGFLRIHGAENPLDASAVHPESYYIVDKIREKLQCSLQELINNKLIHEKINLNEFISQKIGLPTLKDIMEELKKPGRDPREEFDMFEFDKNVTSINDLTVGMLLNGVVTNITNFGCFVDIGVHQDGLVHISQMADRYVANPNDIVKLNQKVLVKVIGLDIERKRINLSMKEAQNQ